MRRYKLDYIVHSGREPLFWEPWGFWKWLLCVICFAACLTIFLLLFCIPHGTQGSDRHTYPEQETGIVLHDGDVEITLRWATADDLDLHCIGPDGEEIYFSKKQSSSGGALDKDMNVNGGRDGTYAVEHIYWPPQQAPMGNYTIFVVLYRKYSLLPKSDFTVRFKAEGCTSPIDTTVRGSVTYYRRTSETITFTVE